MDDDKEEPASGPIEMPIELDLDDEELEVEDALDYAPEKDLVDLAGILGMHNVLNQPQYYNALKGKGQDEITGTTFRYAHHLFSFILNLSGVIRAYEPKMMPDEPDNETDVDDCIKRLEDDDQDLTEVNINNMKRVSKVRLPGSSFQLKLFPGKDPNPDHCRLQ